MLNTYLLILVAFYKKQFILSTSRNLKKIVGVYLLYNIVLVSAVQQSESTLHIYIYIYPLFFGLPSHLGHRRALSRIPRAVQSILIS